MINATELRICNYANIEGHEVIVDGRVICDLWMGRFASAEPIPITEEWLIKLGYKKNIDEDECPYLYAVKGKTSLFERENGYYNFHIEDVLDEGINIKYVHQLQNIYFALTGKELIVREAVM